MQKTIHYKHYKLVSTTQMAWVTITCPDCRGSGLTIYGEQCDRCDGMGEIDVER